MKMAMATPKREMAVRPRLMMTMRSMPIEICPYQQRGAHQQQSKQNEVVKHAVAYRFSESVEGDVCNARAHRAISAGVGASFSTK
jgi:hypothetical protein